MRRSDLPRFAGLRNGDLMRPARQPALRTIVAMATLIAATSLLITLV